MAIAFYLSAILVFGFRLLGRAQYGTWIGYFEFLLAIPLVYLLVTAPRLERPALYYVQIGCMLAWLAVEALLDYVLKANFRGDRSLFGDGCIGLCAACRNRHVMSFACTDGYLIV